MNVRTAYSDLAIICVIIQVHATKFSQVHLQPDLSVVCSKNQISKNGCHGAPTMIIEVLSRSTALKDFNEKFNLYQKYGVQEYWIVDSGNRTVHVYALQDGAYQVRDLHTEQDSKRSNVFKDFKISIGKLFNLEA